MKYVVYFIVAIMFAGSFFIVFKGAKIDPLLFPMPIGKTIMMVPVR